MKIVYVNVLLYAVNEDADHHVAIGVRHTLVHLFARAALPGNRAWRRGNAGEAARGPGGEGVDTDRFRAETRLNLAKQCGPCK